MLAFSLQENPKKLPKMENGNWKLEEVYELRDFKREFKKLIPNIDIDKIVHEIKENQYSIGKVSIIWVAEKTK